MKNNLVSGIAASLLLLSLTACLGGGSNVVTNASVGIIRYNATTGGLAIEAAGFFNYYFAPTNNAALASFGLGDCVYFQYTIDLGAAENSSTNLELTKAYQGTLGSIEMIKAADCQSYMVHDTASLMPSEQKIAYAIDAYGGYTFVSKTFFLLSDIVMMDKQDNQWYMYCDMEAEPATDSSSGNPVYSFFLRSTIRTEGTAPEKNLAVWNAFRMDYLFDRIQNNVKAASKISYIMRIHYIKDIKDGAPVWDSQDLTINLPQES
jgi:hypothetical protein